MVTTVWRNDIATCLISQQGIALLKEREGLRLRAYDDGYGTRTIGYGHTYGVRQGEHITEQEADTLLAQDVDATILDIRKCVTVPLAQYEFDALVSFVFNVGGMKLRASNVLKHLNAQMYDWVPGDLLGWRFVNKVESKGLLKRRQSEAAQFAGRLQQ